MLLKFVKWVVIPVGGFVAAIVFKVVTLAIGRERLKRFVFDFFADPDIQQRFKALGSWDLMSEQLSGLRRADPKGQEWAEFVLNYLDHPDPKRIPEYFEWLEQCHSLEDHGQQLPRAGSILAF